MTDETIPPALTADDIVRVMADANRCLPDGHPAKVTAGDLAEIDALASAARAEWGADAAEYRAAARAHELLATLLPPEGT